jgi:NAD(P)-dependent dehydrogenase (short-subunit alcohol dehydrogenase family)
LTSDLIFDARIRDAFLAASHDRNPLHLDAAYATRTQFGRPIVYGMCGVLAGLAQWSAGRAFTLRKLRVRFERPLLYDMPYTLSFSEQGTDAKIKIANGATTHVSIALAVEWAQSPEAAPPRKAAAFVPLAEALTAAPSDAAYSAFAGTTLDFNSGPQAVHHLLSLVGLNPGQLPPAQILFLLWASYFVGMQVPGRQALFSELTATFDADTSFPGDSKIGEIQFDDRFNRIIASGSLSQTSTFQIGAFVRPLPVNTALDEIRRHPLEPHLFADRSFIISGGTRGFGEALAKTLVLQGGKVGANFRSSADDAERMMRELEGYPFKTYQGDVGDMAMAENIIRNASHDLGPVDVCICNASPPIEAKKFADLGVDGFNRLVAQSMAPTIGLLSAFLKTAPDGGIAVLISSVYAADAPKDFAHYAAAKAAQENLFESLAREYPKHRFLVARLPKILTDQTNLVFDREPPQRADDIAFVLAKRIAAFPAQSNFLRTTIGEIR